MLAPFRKIISVCESKENKRDFFFSCEIYTKISIIDLIIVKLFGVYPMVLPFKKKRFFHVNFIFLCVIVILDC